MEGSARGSVLFPSQTHCSGRDGHIGTYPTSKDRGAEQGDDGPLERSSALGMVAAETRGRVAAPQASGSLPWIGADDTSETKRLQAEHAAKLQRVSNFQLGGPERLTGSDDPRYALQEHGGLADLWNMDDGDIMCHPVLVPSYLHEFDDAKAKVGAERTPQKTEVVHSVDDPVAAPPERCAETGHYLQSNRWEHHTRSRCRTLADSTSRTNSWAKQTSFGQCANVSSCVRTRRQNLCSFVKASASVVSTTSSGCTDRRNELQKPTTRVDKGLLRGSS